MRWLHCYLRLLAAASLLLIAAGGLVTSTDSGLAVPDWPNTYGYFMFSFPFSKMVGGIFYEHGHRLIASTVGLLTIGLVLWAWRAEPRRWVRRMPWSSASASLRRRVGETATGVSSPWVIPFSGVSRWPFRRSSTARSCSARRCVTTTPGSRSPTSRSLLAGFCRRSGVSASDSISRIAWVLLP